MEDTEAIPGVVFGLFPEGNVGGGHCRGLSKKQHDRNGDLGK